MTDVLSSQAEPSDAKRTRMVLADDHIVMRQVLAGLLRLEPVFTVAGEASNGEGAIGLSMFDAYEAVVTPSSGEARKNFYSSRRSLWRASRFPVK